jgi:regulator of sirC expression with transglutaminase-like and TPR domain
MLLSSPLCCAPAAYRVLSRQLPSVATSDGLLNGALAIAMHEMGDVNADAVRADLQDLADRVRGRVHGDQPQALLAHLHDVLFDDEGFTGDQEDYYKPANSYLPVVLESRRGLPITLSLVYKLVADRLGLQCWGVGLPGHFLVGVSDARSKQGGQTMLVDCFNGGRVLSVDDARQQVATQFGDEVEWTDDALRPVSHRHWITRMLQNLLNLFGAQDQFSDVAAMLEMEMLLWPEQRQLQRDLALVLARCGHSRPAGVWLDRYLKSNPDDPQTVELQQLRDVLR